MLVYIYIYLYIWRKLKKKTKYSRCDELMVKSILKGFGFIKASSGLYDGEKLLRKQGCTFFFKK